MTLEPTMRANPERVSTAQHAAMRTAAREIAADREQAWRGAQGPDVAMRYRFILPDDRLDEWQCSGKWAVTSVHMGNRCTRGATRKVARSPYSVTGVRYYCDAHCPQVPEGTP
jgi:hypothetical protein